MHLTKGTKEELIKAVELMKVPPVADLIDQLWLYLNLMAEWNKLVGLTSIPPSDWVRRHIMDSFSLSSFMPSFPTQLADIGSGAGLPAIPLALMARGNNWTLIEKNNKKVAFLLRVKNELELSNVRIVHKRAENLAQDVKEKNSFQTVTARAVGSCVLLCHLAWPLLKRGGRLLAMKGRVDQTELNDLVEPWQTMSINRITLPPLKPDEESMKLSVLVWQKS